MSSQTFSGSAVVIQWIHSGGTATLSGDQRSITINSSMDMHDATAGSDAYRKRLEGIRDMTASYQAILAVGGTALEDALRNADGTLIVGPEGTASGKRKYTLPMLSAGPSVNMPYADVVEITNEFSLNGSPTIATY